MDQIRNILEQILGQLSRLTLNDWATIVSLVISLLAVLYARGRYLLEKRRLKEAQREQARKRLSLNVISCGWYFESFERSKSRGWKTILSGLKLRVVPKEPPLYVSIELVLDNASDAPVFIRMLHVNVQMNELTLLSHAREYYSIGYTGVPPWENGKLRLLDRQSGESVYLDPWFEIKAGEKVIWQIALKTSLIAYEHLFIKWLRLAFLHDTGSIYASVEFTGRMSYDKGAVKRLDALFAEKEDSKL